MYISYTFTVPIWIILSIYIYIYKYTSTVHIHLKGYDNIIHITLYKYTYISTTSVSKDFWLRGVKPHEVLVPVRAVALRAQAAAEDSEPEAQWLGEMVNRWTIKVAFA